MKAFFLAMALMGSNVFAGEILIMDVPAKGTMKSDSHSARFVIDEMNGTGKAVLSVVRSERDCSYGDERPSCTTHYWTILSQSAPIEGLKVVDKQVTFEDRIDCGKMGVSRILKVPTFFMSGNCKLSVNRLKVDGVKRIQVRLITKE